MSLDRIIEVREGQCSEWFERFPYEALGAQSFSIIYEENSMLAHVWILISTLISTSTYMYAEGPYVRLAALSLICGTEEDYKTWIEGVG